MILRRELWRRGLRYRVDVQKLAGRPDVVFAISRVAVFSDGDFWHGKDLQARLAKLARGHNAPYWIEKIRTNTARDVRNNAKLEADGWLVLRFWESDIKRDVSGIAETIARAVEKRRPKR